MGTVLNWHPISWAEYGELTSRELSWFLNPESVHVIRVQCLRAADRRNEKRNRALEQRVAQRERLIEQRLGK